MKNKINIYLIEYAINAIIRDKYKSIFITIIFTILTFLLSSIFFITNSIKYELNSTTNVLPQIIVQKIKAGRNYDIDVNNIENILKIDGVSDAIARVWGYYYFENVGDQDYDSWKEKINEISVGTRFDIVLLNNAIMNVSCDFYHNDTKNEGITKDNDQFRVTLGSTF